LCRCILLPRITVSERRDRRPAQAVPRAADARIEGMDLDAEAVAPHSTAGLRHVVVGATAVMLIAAAPVAAVVL